MMYKRPREAKNNTSNSIQDSTKRLALLVTKNKVVSKVLATTARKRVKKTSWTVAEAVRALSGPAHSIHLNSKEVDKLYLDMRLLFR